MGSIKRSASRLAIAVVASLLGAGSLRVAAHPAPAAPGDLQRLAVVGQYCVTCHNARLKSGGLTLDDLAPANLSANAERLEKVVRRLKMRSMPPSGAPRPGPAVYDDLTSWLETELDQAAAARPNPGRTEPLHRLNRTEYTNAIRDLLGLEAVDVGPLLPPDDSSYGLDNIAGVLGISPTHLEKYLSAARTISRLAVGDPTLLPSAEQHVAAGDLSQNDQLDGLPFGTRGGMLLRRHLPLDAEYILRFRTGRGVGTASTEPQQVEVSVDGQRVELIRLNADARPGPSEMGRPRTEHEVRLALKAGVRDIAVAFVKTTDAEAEGLLQPFERSEGIALTHAAMPGDGVGGPSIQRVSIVGPYRADSAGDTPSRRRIFLCRPTATAGELPCARKIVSTLARRAYRRPVDGSDIDPLIAHYKRGRAAGTFDDGIRLGIERMLASPAFLFRVEQAPPNLPGGAPYRVTDLELASRLSFFLWSSIPDDELLEQAIKGKLREPAVLEAQTRRMLADPRCTLVSSFFNQWLRVRGVREAVFDLLLFPDFDDNLRQALAREMELFTGSIVTEDRSVLDLLRADYTFVNDRLARHYGIPMVYGSQFRRVSLSEQPARHGLLGKGGILTVTSLPNRTSPVGRGKYLLEVMLGAPPPAPPPNVPGLEENTREGKARSMRDAMVRHRANPVCATCHKVMDPLGFALENFDATGAWRAYDAEVPIDASGELPDGSRFSGVVELRTVLLARPESFVTTVTEKLLTYALGRGVEYYDMPAIRRIVRDAAPGDYRFSTLVQGIVKSLPFRMRSSG